MNSRRIWELDALRGICILGMVIVHLLYDLCSLGLVHSSNLLSFVQYWGSTVFFLISGICVTLGSRHIRRGLIVLGCGMVCTLVTIAIYLLDLSGRDIIIYFGVLHCLGVCMLFWALFRRLPKWGLGVLGGLFILAGFFLEQRVFVNFPWLIPLGLRYPGFSSADYFPLLPNLGFFLWGALLGGRLYRHGVTLLPQVNIRTLPVRFLCGCGRHSLLIYLLHQPVITAVIAALLTFY